MDLYNMKMEATAEDEFNEFIDDVLLEDVTGGTIKTDATTAATISPPGGRNETPTSKPYDLSKIASTSEKPSSQPYDAAKISIPGSADINASAYNDILNRLQQSYGSQMKLVAELAEIMQGGTPIDPFVEQENFTEVMIENALIESLLNGPIYESSKNPRKSDIKKAISKIGKNDNKETKYNLVTFQSPVKAGVTGAISASVGGTIGTAFGQALRLAAGEDLSPAAYIAKMLLGVTGAGAAINIGVNVIQKTIYRAYRKDKTFQSKLWQMVGIFNLKEDKINDALTYFHDIFKEEIGDLKFNAIELKINSKGFGGNHILILEEDKSTSEPINVEITKDDLGIKDKKD